MVASVWCDASAPAPGVSSRAPALDRRGLIAQEDAASLAQIRDALRGLVAVTTVIGMSVAQHRSKSTLHLAPGRIDRRLGGAVPARTVDRTETECGECPIAWVREGGDRRGGVAEPDERGDQVGADRTHPSHRASHGRHDDMTQMRFELAGCVHRSEDRLRRCAPPFEVEREVFARSDQAELAAQQTDAIRPGVGCADEAAGCGAPPRAAPSTASGPDAGRDRCRRCGRPRRRRAGSRRSPVAVRPAVGSHRARRGGWGRWRASGRSPVPRARPSAHANRRSPARRQATLVTRTGAAGCGIRWRAPRSPRRRPRHPRWRRAGRWHPRRCAPRRGASNPYGSRSRSRSAAAATKPSTPSESRA